VIAPLVERWAKLYSDHKLVSDTVTFAHLAGIMLGGGVAIAADRAAIHLALASDLPYSPPLGGRDVHRWVVVGLAVITVSGLLMLFADLDTYLKAPLFWVKVGLTLVLIGNGWVRMKAEQAVLAGVQAARARFRQTSVASLALWVVILLAGVMLVTAD
jgi:hypothetical protein